jgi:hypothetical protein
MSTGAATVGVEQRNRRVLWIIFAVMGTLIIASFLVGIRW